MIYGTVPTYEDNDCESEIGSVQAGQSGWAYAQTAEDAEGLCKYGAIALRLHPDLSKATHNPNLYYCGSPPSSHKRARRSAVKVRPWIPTAYVMMTNSAIHLAALNGLDSGIHFQRVGAEGIGIQWVLDLGWLDGVDVWGDVGAGYQVCFPQLGRIVFLDAATAPRTVDIEVPYEFVGGFTCTTMTRAGTLVLVADPVNVPAEGEPMTLLDCSVTNNHALYLRNAPNGAVIMQTVPEDMTFDTWKRTPNWFAVSYDGIYGWANKLFLAENETCRYAPVDLQPVANGG